MKRMILLTSACLSMICFQAKAQSDDDSDEPIRRHQMLFSPFHLFAGTFMVSYEYLYPSKGSLRITPSVTLNNLGERESREGVGIDVGYKIFLLEKRKINVYMGPYALYKYRKQTYEDYDRNFILSSETYNVFGLGIDTGVKFTFGRFTMDVTVGGGVRYPVFDGNEQHTSWNFMDDRYKGIAPRVNFSLGVAL